MLERLILCEFAVADLTTANANVFYELGLGYAVRPSSTVLAFAEGGRELPSMSLLCGPKLSTHSFAVSRPIGAMPTPASTRLR